MKNSLLVALAATVAFGAVQPARATITWTEWDPAAAGSTTVTGTAGSLGVTYSGEPVAFVQSAPGTDFYTGTAFPAPYKPSNTDIVGLNAHGDYTITFSSPVTNLFLALESWNATNIYFDQPFVTVTPLVQSSSFGGGTLPASGTSIVPAVGEENGVLEFAGPISSLTITSTNDEFWHGFTVGFEGLVASAVPEPSTWALMIVGLGLVGAATRRARKVRTSVSYA